MTPPETPPQPETQQASFAAPSGSASGIDPYEAYFDWCKVNGYRDVAECDVKDLDVRRMDESIAAYAKSPNDPSSATRPT